MPILPLYLLIFAVPFGVAGQSLICVIVGALLLLQMMFDKKSLKTRKFWRNFKIPVVSSVLLVLLFFVANLLKTEPMVSSFSFVGGYLFFLLFPPMAVLNYYNLQEKDWQKLFSWFGVICGIWGLIALSQFFWGWRIVGSSFAEAGSRAYGFYSHPLTLAYTAILGFPLAVSALIREPTRKACWSMFLGLSVILYVSESRTIQAVAALIVVYNIFKYSKGKTKRWLLALMLIGGVLVSVTDNAVSNKFAQMAAGTEDVKSDYPDDRLAFWHAHYEMFKEKPFFGHGTHLNQDYRQKYYEKIGLSGFSKMYEAHNMYIQLAVTGGIFALFVFLVWFCWHALHAWSSALYGGDVIFQTLGAIALASITQNSFQDSEVRFAIVLVCSCVWVLVGKKKLGTFSL